jgi:hypothetical protein
MDNDTNREDPAVPADAARPVHTPPPAPDRTAGGATPRPAGADPAVAKRPVPGVKHEPEPDAENIMPAEDEPGTL